MSGAVALCMSSWIFDDEESAQNAGFALMKMMGSVGSFCGPFLIGALSDEYEGSFVPPVLLLSGFLLLASVLHFLFREPGKRSLVTM